MRPLRGWREGTDDISDYDLALYPKYTSKEFIIVFQNERDEKKRLQWNLDLTKGQGNKKNSEPPNDTLGTRGFSRVRREMWQNFQKEKVFEDVSL